MSEKRDAPLRLLISHPQWSFDGDACGGDKAADSARPENTINLHSTNVFLNHVQMDPETVQIDFEWARNLAAYVPGYQPPDKNTGLSDAVTPFWMNA